MEYAYLVCYDISSDRRWRKVYRTMKSYGEWLQLSVFQCRLTRQKLLYMKSELDKIVDHGEDHVLIIRVGPADNLKLQVESIGKPFEPIDRRPVIV